MNTVIGFARAIDHKPLMLHAMVGSHPLCGVKPRGWTTYEEYQPALLCGKCARSMESRIRAGMARAFFGSAWADQAEETGNAHILSGKDITDIMPSKIDPSAIHAADTLAFDMVRANGGAWLRTLYAMNPGKPRQPLDSWGASAALQAMGSGAGLTDYGIDIPVPYVEFGSHSLERDYF